MPIARKSLINTIFSISVLNSLLLASSSPCYALMSIGQITKERAKTLGMEIRLKPAGPKAVEVELEFPTKGELRNFSRVDLQIKDGEKLLVSASLKDEPSSQGRVVVSFTADRANLDMITLRVVMQPSGTMTGYDLRVRDFVEPSQASLRAATLGGSPAEPAKGQQILTPEQIFGDQVTGDVRLEFTVGAVALGGTPFDMEEATNRSRVPTADGKFAVCASGSSWPRTWKLA